MTEQVESVFDARVLQGVDQLVDEDIDSVEQQRFGWQMRRTARNEDENSRITRCHNLTESNVSDR